MAAGAGTAACGSSKLAVGASTHALVVPATYVKTVPAFGPDTTLTVALATGGFAAHPLPDHSTTLSASVAQSPVAPVGGTR